MATRAQVLIPVIIAAIIVGAIGVFTIPKESKLADVSFPTGTIKIDNQTLTVQVAESDAQKIRGLMFLDIIWFDSNGNVLHIATNVQPCKSALETATCPTDDGGGKMAKYVLEVTSGFVDKFNITGNSKLQIISI